MLKYREREGVGNAKRSMDDVQDGWRAKTTKRVTEHGGGNSLRWVNAFLVENRVDSRMQWFIGSSLSGGVVK